MYCETDKKNQKTKTENRTDNEKVSKKTFPHKPIPEMRLYGICETYFTTQGELEDYCQREGISMKDTLILDYIRNIADRSDIIRTTTQGGRVMLYTVVDEDVYGVYIQDGSIYKGKSVWEFCHGSIDSMYTPFRERGIVFENDIYERISTRNKQLLKNCMEQNLFNMRKNN